MTQTTDPRSDNWPAPWGPPTSEGSPDVDPATSPGQVDQPGAEQSEPVQPEPEQSEPVQPEQLWQASGPLTQEYDPGQTQPAGYPQVGYPQPSGHPYAPPSPAHDRSGYPPQPPAGGYPLRSWAGDGGA